MLHPADEEMHPGCRRLILKVKIVKVKDPEMISATPHLSFMSEWTDEKCRQRRGWKKGECGEYKRAAEKTDDG